MPLEFVRSEILLKGRAFKIRQDTLKTPDGQEFKYEIIEHGGSVVIVPVDEDANILLVRQYRHATGMDLLELPAGTLDGEEPFEVCAARELREETGMEAGQLQRLGGFYLAPGYSSEFMAVFLATDLKHNPLAGDDDEFLEVEKIPAKDAISMFERDEVLDAKSLAAWLLVKPHLEKFLG
ncbi:MAG TPA: NUDIX hydrolase [Anaerolineales bacterium]|nr:NUDIX hydrolase [Anaerolineales bacterium]